MIKVKTTNDLYRYAQYIAKRNYREYSKIFLSNALDCKDVEQESYITTWQVIAKYPQKDISELQRIVCGAVCNRINNLRVRNPMIRMERSLSKKGNIEIKYDMIQIEDILESEDALIEAKYPERGVDALKRFCEHYEIEHLYNLFYKKYIELQSDFQIAKYYNIKYRELIKTFKYYKPFLKFFFREEIR